MSDNIKLKPGEKIIIYMSKIVINDSKQPILIQNTGNKSIYIGD